MKKKQLLHNVTTMGMAYYDGLEFLRICALGAAAGEDADNDVVAHQEGERIPEDNPQPGNDVVATFIARGGLVGLIMTELNADTYALLKAFPTVGAQADQDRARMGAEIDRADSLYLVTRTPEGQVTSYELDLSSTTGHTLLFQSKTGFPFVRAWDGSKPARLEFEEVESADEDVDETARDAAAELQQAQT